MIYLLLLFNFAFGHQCDTAYFQIYYQAPIEVGLEIHPLLTKNDILEILDTDTFNQHYLELAKEYYELKNLSKTELEKIHYNRYGDRDPSLVTKVHIQSQAEKYAKKFLSFNEYLSFSSAKRKNMSEYKDFINAPETAEELANYAYRFIIDYPEYFPKLDVKFVSLRNYNVKEKEGQFSQDNKYKSIHELLDNEMDNFLAPMKRPDSFNAFFKKLIYFFFTDPPKTNLSPDEYASERKKDITARMDILLKLFLKAKKAKEEAERLKNAQNKLEIPHDDAIETETETPNPDPRTPTYSSRPLRVKAETPEPPQVEVAKIEIKSHKDLLPEQRKELVSKHIPPFIHSRVYKALDKIQGKLTEKEYQKVYKMIVDVLAKSEAKIRPLDIPELDQTFKKDIWKMNPHVPNLIRIYFGKGSNGNLMLLSVEEDIKSGDKREIKIISDLDEEWAKLRTRHGY